MLERLLQFQKELYLTAGRRKKGHTRAKFTSVCWHLTNSLVSIPRISLKVREKSMGNSTMTHSYLNKWKENLKEEIYIYIYIYILVALDHTCDCNIA
jgi:hypothetical protein